MPDGALHTLSQPQACAFIAQYESCYTPEHTRAWVSDTLPTLRNCIEVSLQNVKLYSLESMAHGGHYSELGRKVLTFLSFMATLAVEGPGIFLCLASHERLGQTTARWR